MKRISLLLIAVVVLLSGCDMVKPDYTFGSGTIVHLDGDLTYRQDNDWVFSSNYLQTLCRYCNSKKGTK